MKIYKLIQVWCLVVAHCTKITICTCNIQSVEPLRTAINWKFSSLIISDIVEYFCTLFWFCLLEKSILLAWIVPMIYPIITDKRNNPQPIVSSLADIPFNEINYKLFSSTKLKSDCILCYFVYKNTNVRWKN